MGKDGRAFTLLGFDEKGLLRAIQNQTNITLKELHLNVEMIAPYRFQLRRGIILTEAREAREGMGILAEKEEAVEADEDIEEAEAAATDSNYIT